MQKVDAKDKFIPKGEFVSAEIFTYSKKLPIYNRHEGYEIYAALSGEATCFIDGREFAYTKNDVGFCPEGIYHGTLVRRKYRFAAIHVRPSLLFSNPDLIKAFLRPFPSDGRYFKVPNRPDLAKAITEYVAFYAKHKNEPASLANGLITLMAQFQSLPASKEPSLFAEREKIQPAITLMHERFHEPLDVIQLAKACSLSRATFYRLFTRVYRLNPKAMLNDIRLQRAMVLLISTNKKITEIALDTGYFNLSNFNRMFQKKTGKSPREYRAAEAES